VALVESAGMETAARTGRLPQYRGELSAAEIADGMTAAAQNATRLLDDATTLLAAGRCPTAISIALLAIEEAGKIAVLRGMSLARTPTEWRALWKAYRDHRSKHTAWSFRALPFDVRIPGTDHHAAMFDSFKQLGVYTDCVGQRVWFRPTDLMDEELAREFIENTAKPLLEPVQRDFSAREVELWQEHLGPAWKKDEKTVGAAMVRWAAALQAEGLQAALDVAGAVAFVPPEAK